MAGAPPAPTLSFGVDDRAMNVGVLTDELPRRGGDARRLLRRVRSSPIDGAGPSARPAQTAPGSPEAQAPRGTAAGTVEGTPVEERDFVRLQLLTDALVRVERESKLVASERKTVQRESRVVLDDIREARMPVARMAEVVGLPARMLNIRTTHATFLTVVASAEDFVAYVRTHLPRFSDRAKVEGWLDKLEHAAQRLQRLAAAQEGAREQAVGAGAGELRADALGMAQAFPRERTQCVRPIPTGPFLGPAVPDQVDPHLTPRESTRARA